MRANCKKYARTYERGRERDRVLHARFGWNDKRKVRSILREYTF